MEELRLRLKRVWRLAAPRLVGACASAGKVDVMQVRADLLVPGGGGIVGVERTDGMFPGLWVRASKPTEPLLPLLIG